MGYMRLVGSCRVVKGGKTVIEKGKRGERGKVCVKRAGNVKLQTRGVTCRAAAKVCSSVLAVKLCRAPYAHGAVYANVRVCPNAQRVRVCVCVLMRHIRCGKAAVKGAAICTTHVGCGGACGIGVGRLCAFL